MFILCSLYVVTYPTVFRVVPVPGRGLEYSERFPVDRRGPDVSDEHFRPQREPRTCVCRTEGRWVIPQKTKRKKEKKKLQHRTVKRTDEAHLCSHLCTSCWTGRRESESLTQEVGKEEVSGRIQKVPLNDIITISWNRWRSWLPGLHRESTLWPLRVQENVILRFSVYHSSPPFPPPGGENHNVSTTWSVMTTHTSFGKVLKTMDDCLGHVVCDKKWKWSVTGDERFRVHISLWGSSSSRSLKTAECRNGSAWYN